MTDNLRDLEEHLRALGLPKDGVAWVLHAFGSAPARRVGGTPFPSVASRYASRRMGVVIQSESSTGELSEILDCEFDAENVVAFLDQPRERIYFQGTRSDGVTCTLGHTVDSLQVRRDGIYAIEIKSDAALRKECRRRPKDWICENGTYRYLPVERAFAELGIRHQVKPVSSFNQVRSENLLLLLQARKTPVRSRQKALRDRVIRFLKRSPMTLEDLRARLGIADITPLLHLILNRYIDADISTNRLALPETAWVGALGDDLSRLTAKDSRFPLGLGANERVDTSTALSLDMSRSAHECLRQLALGPKAKRSPRTLRRYRAKLRASNGDHRALAHKYWAVKRPRSYLGPTHEKFIRRIIKKIYGSPVAPGPYKTYIVYRKRFMASKLAAKGQRVAAFNTFAKRIHWLDQKVLATARGGHRMGTSAAPPIDPTTASFRAAWPFHSAHIDHYLCDLWAVVARTSVATYVARPVLTVMQDDCSGEVLAIHLGFSAPSKKACAGVLRDCVRRHRRLPEWVIVDHGVEFKSVYFETTLATLEVSKHERPVGAGRWGGSLERTFGVTKHELYGSLPGNSINKTHIRSVSSSHRPQKTASLTLYDVYRKTEKYFFEHWNKHPRGNGTVAPELIREQGLRRFGCAGVKIDYDLSFLISTALPLPKKKYPIDLQRGVRIDGAWYRNPAMFTSKCDCVTDVRKEAWDDNTIYFLIDSVWYVAHTRRAADRSGVFQMCASIGREDSKAVIGQMKYARDSELVALIHDRGSHVRTAKRQAIDAPGQPAKAAHKSRAKNVKPLIVQPLPVRVRGAA